MTDKPISGGASERWTDNAGATRRVSELLYESGAPLEAHINKLCGRYASAVSDPETVIVQAEPVVYGIDEERPLREIDQLVTYYQEIEVSPLLGIQLILNVPIEVKHRDKVQLFGIEVGNSSIPPGAVVVSGDLSRSRLIREQVACRLPRHMATDSGRRIATIKFDDSLTPKSVFAENIVQNSAASLFDFIRAIDAHGPGSGSLAMQEDGAIDEFEEYLESTRYYGPMVARRWAAELPSQRVKKYAQTVTDGRRVYYSVNAYVPVLVLDSELHVVHLDEVGEVIRYEPRNILLTLVRVVGWTSTTNAPFALRSAEAVVSVVNPYGLEALLPQLHDYFHAIREGLLSQDEEMAARAIFEHDFLSAIAARYYPVGMYRSDLDDLQW